MLKSVGEGETFDLLQDYFYVQELRTKRSPEAGIEREGCFFFFLGVVKQVYRCC